MGKNGRERSKERRERKRDFGRKGEREREREILGEREREREREIVGERGGLRWPL